MYASENNHHQIVKYLLKAGAVIDSKVHVFLINKMFLNFKKKLFHIYLFGYKMDFLLF